MAPKGSSRAYRARTGRSMLAPDSWFPPEMVGRSPVAELISDTLPQAQACCVKICASSHFTCRSRSSFLPIWSSILLAFWACVPFGWVVYTGGCLAFSCGQAQDAASQISPLSHPPRLHHTPILSFVLAPSSGSCSRG